MLSEEYIAALPPCEDGCEDGGTPCELREALRWLARKSERYDPQKFTPPLRPRRTSDTPRKFVALTMRVRRKQRLGSGSRIGRIDYWDGTTERVVSIGTLIQASCFATNLLTSSRSGYLLVTSGKDRRVLDLFLQDFGQGLLDLGYRLYPCISGSRISFIRITKGHKTWTLCYAESVSGVPVSTMLDYARDAGYDSRQYRTGDARSLYNAIAAYQSFLVENFGVAINPTAGMTAIRCARGYLPDDYCKWRPSPLLVAMERHGKGYRGGLTYAQRYRGKSWRIDVNRQYTAALGTPLPYRAAFGRYVSPEKTPHGVFVCQVQVGNQLPYPLGVWGGEASGFTLQYVTAGTYVSVLHTSEFMGIERAGGHVIPYYGYVFTHCVDFSRYVECLQSLYSEHGRGSPVADFIKPLGNYVYGKLGQNPWRQELLFSNEKQPAPWFPYMDDTLTVWPQIWVKKARRVTSSQHVDIAGTITGAARSQTLSMVAYLRSLGANILRVHTDSITLDLDPDTLPEIDDMMDSGIIGKWRLESEDADTIIIGANAYIDQKGAHVAGLSAPTWKMVERIYDGHVAYVVRQNVTTPLRGFARELIRIRREYG